MALRKMILLPDSDGYGSTDGTEWLRSELDGGVGRYRKDKIGASKSVSVRWTMNPQQYAYWRAFYALVGSDKFLCDLVSEDGKGPAEHEVNFIPGSVTLPSQVGLTYVQAASLEVKPLARDPAADAILVLVFTESGGYPDQWFNALAKLATVTIPGAEAFRA